MKIQYNKKEIIAAAQYILENSPSSKVVSDIPHTKRGYQAERGFVDDILANLRSLAKENKKVHEDMQKALAAGDANVDHIWNKWIEVVGVGGYWIISHIEGNTINFAIAVSPWFGEHSYTFEEI